MYGVNILDEIPPEAATSWTGATSIASVSNVLLPRRCSHAVGRVATRELSRMGIFTRPALTIARIYECRWQVESSAIPAALILFDVSPDTSARI